MDAKEMLDDFIALTWWLLLGQIFRDAQCGNMKCENEPICVESSPTLWHRCGSSSGLTCTTPTQILYISHHVSFLHVP